ncbi:YegP family protein [uncultured Ruegeria sp.]|uniref:YegP family protein n=1 Tax=uncultured Ruegeria sp. TaxID=259304 RepID=UPI002627C1F7|nr:YegP family protein [uncultured Ruegeria sp.]
MAGKFELFEDKAGEFRFRLKAENGEIILASGGYIQQASAENGIALVKINALNDDRYERKETKSGGHMFNLKASNGEFIGASESYTSVSERDNGIETVKRNAPDAWVEDLTPGDSNEDEFDEFGIDRTRVAWALNEAAEDTYAFLTSAENCLNNILKTTERRIPNDPSRRQAWEDEIAFLRIAQNHIEKLKGLVPNEENSDAVSVTKIDETRSALRDYIDHFKSWPKEHVKEVTDSVWRAGLIGIFTGVGLAFGIPGIGALIGTTLFGGEKISKAVNTIIKGGGT